MSENFTKPLTTATLNTSKKDQETLLDAINNVVETETMVKN